MKKKPSKNKCICRKIRNDPYNNSCRWWCDVHGKVNRRLPHMEIPESRKLGFFQSGKET